MSLGEYEPHGWERTGQSWFVDKSGWSEPWDLALAWDRLKVELQDDIAEKPDHGFGITEEGQFQLYVSAFRCMRTRA
jgi:hypothetical protein